MTRSDRDEYHRARDRVDEKQLQRWPQSESESEERGASRSQHSSFEASTETASVPRRILEQHQADPDRKNRLAEQGWVEKHGRCKDGYTVSWSIKRVNPNRATQSNANTPRFNYRFREEELRKYRDSSRAEGRIGSLRAEEHQQVMEARAYLNSSDTGFQERFAAKLAELDRKKTRADGGNMDREAGSYDADTSNLSEAGGENDVTSDIITGGLQQEKSNDSPFKDGIAKELTKGLTKNVSDQLDQLDLEGSNNDADMSDFNAERREAKKARRAFFRDDSIIVQADDGTPIPLWVKKLKASRKLKKERRAREKFEERFNKVLAKHDGKKNQSDDGKMDLEIVNGRDDHGGKRKRDVKDEDEDEDEVRQSMQYEQPTNGRKRSRNVERDDYPIDLAMERTHFSPERQRDYYPPRHSRERWSQHSRDGYRSERSLERRPTHDGMKSELSSYRHDRNSRDSRDTQYRDRGRRSPEPSHRGRSEREHDFISFSDPFEDDFDNRRGERTQGKYWKGLNQEQKYDTSVYREIMNNIDKSRENQEQRPGQEYHESFRRRSASPRQVCTSLDSGHDRLTAMEEQMVFFPKEYL
ncbi:hypothetical protein NA56DRAFT_442694 [Hyaloscypha hepaticicola]|uniref:Uncharacterized protein n=1 Tax=Hyaloscypha hepaticicola TaxID=2082293 RepID=A0A2J6PGT5_9HELO|nr:hypothetical protein NA56DRAFT_442694 [Hyaloscypha hepaticicola]